MQVRLCSACPDGYTANTTNGKTVNTQCQINVTGGHYVGTSGQNSTNWGTCAIGTAKGAHTVNYGSTSSCAACSGATYADSTGMSVCTSCPTASTYAADVTGYGNNGKTSKSKCWASFKAGTANGTMTSHSCYLHSGTDYGTLTSGSNCWSYSSELTCNAAYYSPITPNTYGEIWFASHTAALNNACASVGTGYWSPADSLTRTQCPANYRAGAAASAESGCLTSCSNGQYVATANAACTTVGTGYYRAAHTVNYGSTSTRTQCPANYRTGAATGTEAGCQTSCAKGTRVATANAACSVVTGNAYMTTAHNVNYGLLSPAATSCPSSYTIAGTTAADHDAKSDCTISCAKGTQVAATDAVCTTPTGSWYTAAHTVAAGSLSASNVKSCLTNYATPSTTTATDHDASTDCTISCGAGTQIASNNVTSCTTPAGNWYIGAHTVAQGSKSSPISCLANYVASGTAATNHDAENDCKITCSGGSYLAAARNTSCANVGAGYWAAQSVVPQGSAGVRTQCESGMTTIGYGAGADEVGDCGRVLNFNGEKVYLRSVKKTTPSLNVSISGKTYYGNMDTAAKGSLRIKRDSTTYSVYDDSL